MMENKNNKRKNGDNLPKKMKEETNMRKKKKTVDHNDIHDLYAWLDPVFPGQRRIPTKQQNSKVEVVAKKKTTKPTKPSLSKKNVADIHDLYAWLDPVFPGQRRIPTKQQNSKVEVVGKKNINTPKVSKETMKKKKI
jgi:hypothetical protein